MTDGAWGTRPATEPKMTEERAAEAFQGFVLGQIDGRQISEPDPAGEASDLASKFGDSDIERRRNIEHEIAEGVMNDLSQASMDRLHAALASLPPIGSADGGPRGRAEGVSVDAGDVFGEAMAAALDNRPPVWNKIGGNA